jgi:hypothetical protein
MATSSSDSVCTLGVTRMAIAPGSTQALFIDINATENNFLFKYQSGGTLEILGATGPLGSTLTVAQLATANQTGYLVGTSEVLSIGGACRFYLSATGATTLVHMLRGRSAGP